MGTEYTTASLQKYHIISVIQIAIQNVHLKIGKMTSLYSSSIIIFNHL